MKSNNHSIDDLLQKNRSTQLRYFRERNIAFLEILSPIYEAYQAHLQSRHEIIQPVNENFLKNEKIERKMISKLN
jgi:hypothetical protein